MVFWAQPYLPLGEPGVDHRSEFLHLDAVSVRAVVLPAGEQVVGGKAAGDGPVGAARLGGDLRDRPAPVAELSQEVAVDDGSVDRDGNA